MRVWPFNRKTQAEAEALPEEVKEYYESGRKQQTGMAWLLAFGTLVVTVVLALLLFFGGRWIYQKITNNDQPEAPVKEQPAQQDQTANTQPEGTNENTDQQGSSSTNTTTPNTANNPNTIAPNTGSTTTEVPDTGPGPNGLQ
jgi:cytoskeletal protein RodZ